MKYPNISVENLVDSHGVITFAANFDEQNFTLGISTDAGTLELQTTPSN